MTTALLPFTPIYYLLPTTYYLLSSAYCLSTGWPIGFNRSSNR